MQIFNTVIQYAIILLNVIVNINCICLRDYVFLFFIL